MSECVGSHAKLSKYYNLTCFNETIGETLGNFVQLYLTFGQLKHIFFVTGSYRVICRLHQQVLIENINEVMMPFLLFVFCLQCKLLKNINSMTEPKKKNQKYNSQDNKQWISKKKLQSLRKITRERMCLIDYECAGDFYVVMVNRISRPWNIYI